MSSEADKDAAASRADRSENVLDKPPAREQTPAPTAGAKHPFRYRPQFGVIVVCETEADQRRTYNKLRRQGFDCRVVAV